MLEGSSARLLVARHNLTGVVITIKSIDGTKVVKMWQRDRISEAESLQLCKGSAFVMNLVEKFTLKDRVYLVTKYAAGGNLLDYCLKQEELCI